MTTTTTTTTKAKAVAKLTTEQKAMITAILSADDKAEAAKATATERWYSVMVLALGDDAKLTEALRSEYVAKRIAKAAKAKRTEATEAKAAKLTEAEAEAVKLTEAETEAAKLTEAEAEAVTTSAKNVWKQRKAEAKRKMAAGGDKAVTGRDVKKAKAAPSKAERLGAITGAIRLAVEAGCTAEAIAEAIAEADKPAAE